MEEHETILRHIFDVMSVVDIVLVMSDPVMASIRAAQMIGSFRKKYSIVALRSSRKQTKGTR